MDPMMMKEHHHDGDYANGQWVEIHDYHSPPHHSPMHEYNGFGYMSSSHLPLEPAYNRSLPSSYQMHQPLQPLITAQWPSMLTSPSNSAPPTLPAAPPLAPVSTVATAHPLPPITNPPSAPSSRRTLTDTDRRRMCQYHEDNPTVKQTEIGAMFGVERSTVSKVLRQKDKYLFPDDGSRSPIKRSKGKFPDIERALSNWARNHQRQGLPLSDSIIRDKARFFANTVGSSESHVKVNSSSWLEKFKQKNHLLGAKPRKASDANDSDCGLNLDSKSGSHTPNGISPVSPSGLASPSPISPSRSHDNLKTESPDSYIDFSVGYRHAHSQSATSLASCFSDNTAPSSFSGGPQSPTSPFFSPDVSCGASPFLGSQHPRLMTLASANTARPRSQTFPMLGVESTYVTPPASSSSGEAFTPKYLQQQSMATPALETPIEELPEQPLALPPASMHHHQHSSAANTPILNQLSSPASMAPPPQPPSINTSSPTLTSTLTSLTSALSPNTSSSTISSPTSASISTSQPSQDEARRALQLVMQFFQQQPSGVDPQEYFTMGKLMEKLKMQQQQQQQQQAGGGGGAGLGIGIGSGMDLEQQHELPGGMHSMDLEMEVDMQRERERRSREVGRKRSIHSL
ncbi:hypothetical protein MMC24_004217 [Lignoscripta atroalba]|nr:hypothetical protein [Lignoscripta atroalba]